MSKRARVPDEILESR